MNENIIVSLMNKEHTTSFYTRKSSHTNYCTL